MNSGKQHDTGPAASERAVQLLRSLGWEPLDASQGLSLRGGRSSEVLLRAVLEERLEAINSFEHQGQRRSPSRESIEAAVQALQRSSQEELRHANEKVWSLLRVGTPVREPLDGDIRSLRMCYVDWDNPQNNRYHLLERFPVTGPSGTRTPDCVLSVNGMPFVILEMKSPRSGGEQLDEAISQLQSYQHSQSIPQLFHYVQLLLAASPKSAAYGVIGAERVQWSEWRETQGAPADIRSLVEGDTADTFNPFAESHVPPVLNEQDRLLYSLCRPSRLLDLIRWFTFFRDGHRIMARHYQYSAVQAVLRQVTRPESDGRRPGGLVWHTQGSGKSYTMSMLSRVLLEVFSQRKARVVVVSDRGELDNQIHRDLLAAGIDCRQAATGRELRSLLSDPQVRAVTTVIQKFGSAANSDILVAESPDIFVLVDEAHRTQSGRLTHSMRWMLPRACFIGFTGTPVPRTLEAFGEVVARYTFEEAIEDRTLLPLYWEDHSAGFPEKVGFNFTGAIAAESLTEDALVFPDRELSPFENPDRIRAIAAHIATHFTKHFSGSPLKGIVVAPNRESAVLFKRCLDDIGAISSAVVISFEDREYAWEGTLLHGFRQELLHWFGSEARYEVDVIKRFSDTGDPKLLIVVDKLLTSLDVPRNSVLYLTRPLRGHVLLQSVARINRLYEGKNHGLVVDYVGAIGHLAELSSVYGSGLGIRAANPSREPGRKPTQNLHAEARVPSDRAQERRGKPPAALERASEEILKRELGPSRSLIASAVVQKVAAQIAGAIFSRRKIDWASDADIQNQMKTAVEDVLFDMQAEEGVLVPLACVDAIMDFCVESARQIVS